MTLAIETMLASITSLVYHESAGFGQGFTVARVTKMKDPCKAVSMCRAYNDPAIIAGSCNMRLRVTLRL